MIKMTVEQRNTELPHTYLSINGMPEIVSEKNAFPKILNMFIDWLKGADSASCCFEANGNRTVIMCLAESGKTNNAAMTLLSGYGTPDMHAKTEMIIPPSHILSESMNRLILETCEAAEIKISDPDFEEDMVHLIKQIQSRIVPTRLYHITDGQSMRSILHGPLPGLHPYIGKRSKEAGEKSAAVWLCDHEMVNKWHCVFPELDDTIVIENTRRAGCIRHVRGGLYASSSTISKSLCQETACGPVPDCTRIEVCKDHLGMLNDTIVGTIMLLDACSAESRTAKAEWETRANSISKKTACVAKRIRNINMDIWLDPDSIHKELSRDSRQNVPLMTDEYGSTGKNMIQMLVEYEGYKGGFARKMLYDAVSDCMPLLMEMRTGKYVPPKIRA